MGELSDRKVDIFNAMILQEISLISAYDSLVLMNFYKLLACVDDVNWNNGAGHNCSSYTYIWCEDGKAKPGMEWTLGENYRYPEHHCCTCGKLNNSK